MPTIATSVPSYWDKNISCDAWYSMKSSPETMITLMQTPDRSLSECILSRMRLPESFSGEESPTLVGKLRSKKTRSISLEWESRIFIASATVSAVPIMSSAPQKFSSAKQSTTVRRSSCLSSTINVLGLCNMLIGLLCIECCDESDTVDTLSAVVIWGQRTIATMGAKRFSDNS